MKDAPIADAKRERRVTRSGCGDDGTRFLRMQGNFDPDAYLFLTGRLKEIINRGGEKISPREIDEVLLEHLAVMQAVTFAAPNLRLGEEIMAAVVLRPESAHVAGKGLERDLREFVGGRLSDFKIPARIFFLDELPKGPTGKVQRIGLAGVLGISVEAPENETMAHPDPTDTPLTPLEEDIVVVCRDILARPQVGLYDNFFLVGGDSLLAARLMARLEESQGISLSLVRLMETPTAAGFAQAIEEARAEQQDLEDATAHLLAEMESLTDDEAEQLLRQLEANERTK